MVSKLKSVALTAGLMGILFSQNSHATIDGKKSKATLAEMVSHDNAPYDESISVTFAGDKTREEFFSTYFNMAKIALKELEFPLPDRPEILFPKKNSDISDKITAGKVYFLADVKKSGFINGYPNYSFHIEGSNTIHYTMDPLMISGKQLLENENLEMAMYKASFYSLANPQIMNNAMRIIETDRHKFKSEEDFSRAVNNSVEEARWMNAQVVNSLFRGWLSLQEGIEDISHKDILKEISKEYKVAQNQDSLLFGEFLHHSKKSRLDFMKAFIKDYFSNPYGVYRKLRDLERNYALKK